MTSYDMMLNYVGHVTVAGSFHFALKHNNSTYRDLLESNFIGDGSFQLYK